MISPGFSTSAIRGKTLSEGVSSENGFLNACRCAVLLLRLESWLKDRRSLRLFGQLRVRGLASKLRGDANLVGAERDEPLNLA